MLTAHAADYTSGTSTDFSISTHTEPDGGSFTLGDEAATVRPSPRLPVSGEASVVQFLRLEYFRCKTGMAEIWSGVRASQSRPAGRLGD